MLRYYDAAVATSGEGEAWIVPVFFMTFIFFAAFILLDLMTGVVLESVLSTARQDEEQQATRVVSLRRSVPYDGVIFKGALISGRFIRGHLSIRVFICSSKGAHTYTL